jgi:acetoin utilization deacetylase AcuC-like enzyme
MKALYSDSHDRHNPPYEIFNAEQTPHQEVPERVGRITTALQQSGYEVVLGTETVPASLLEQVHNPEYLQFVEQYSQNVPEHEYRYPSSFPYRAGFRSTAPLAQFGYYSFDLYTPILRHTWEVAVGSASLAYEAARLVQSGTEKVAYALCRPPGHHAEYDPMGLITVLWQPSISLSLVRLQHLM